MYGLLLAEEAAELPIDLLSYAVLALGIVFVLAWVGYVAR